MWEIGWSHRAAHALCRSLYEKKEKKKIKSAALSSQFLSGATIYVRFGVGVRDANICRMSRDQERGSENSYPTVHNDTGFTGLLRTT